MKSKLILFLLSTTLVFTASAAMASPSHSKSEIGQPGDAKKAGRTIEIRMGDIFFEPKSIDIKAGETVRFVLKNEGSLLHEFNLGMAAAHAAHQKEMAAMFQNGTLPPTAAQHMSNMGHAMSGMKMAGMQHDEPNSVLIEPGATEELVWTFTKAKGLEFACNIPGHYQSGMVGKVNVR
ncbi:MAG: cupredoxin family protein [Pseudomonas sp.]|nr:cupredoxin family protein [Pseudomonas sp.]